MTIKEIEDYINTYRMYPDEYKGKRDLSLLTIMNSRYKFNRKDKTITRLEGRINDNGDFELVGSYTFPVGRPEEKVETGALDFNQLVRGYNQLMIDLGYQDKTIGLEFSGDTASWNVRDIVSEIEYVRSTFYDKDHVNAKLRDEDSRRFNNVTGRLRYFIRTYKPFIEDITATTKHNSKYD